MSRPLRIEYEGAVYHVTSRGNARADIYLSDDDKVLFLEVLEHVVEQFGWICHAYCLMSNHYHLMVETPQANLSRGMRQLNGMYTQRFNRKHNRVGHVFQGRFKSIVVDKDAYLLELSRYIVRNPVAADMVKHAKHWEWSSYRATAGMIQSPPFLSVNWLLEQFGNDKNQAMNAYRQFVNKTDELLPWKNLNGPDVLGNDDFRSELQALVTGDKRDIPKRKQMLRCLPLSEIAAANKRRGQWMKEAYQDHGYSMQSIADYAGLHHSTVSRLINGENKNARNKA